MTASYWDSYYISSEGEEMMAQCLNHLPKVIWLIDGGAGFGAQIFQDPNSVLFHCTPLPWLRKGFKIKPGDFGFHNLSENSSECLTSSLLR